MGTTTTRAAPSRFPAAAGSWSARIEVEPDAIVRAMLAGDFYASTGVTLADIRADEERLVVDLAPRTGSRS